MNTNESTRLPRSPDLLHRNDSFLLVIDAQEKLISLTETPNRLVFNIGRLIEAASVLEIETAATEQYPEKLGLTHPAIRERLAAPAPKRAFSCGECGDLFQGLANRGLHKAVLCGMETHVCVLQTALDLLSAGFYVHLVVDALASRHALDHNMALRRLESAGAAITTTETVMFEWCETSTAAGFKQISQLVRTPTPDE